MRHTSHTHHILFLLMGLGIAFANIAHPVQTCVANVLHDYESYVTVSRGQTTAGRM